jgi:glutamine amidotransferase
MIAVIDYGMGNLRSVHKALVVAGAKASVTSTARDIRRAGKIVFPGVGAFGEAMRELQRRKLIRPILEAIAEGKHFLGLCLGLQLLFEKSEEAPGVKGLCVLKGGVKRFRFTRYDVRRTKHVLKVPHMGWNNVTRKAQLKRGGPDILAGVPDRSYMYFVHSYYVKPEDERTMLAVTDYGIRFASAVNMDNVWGLQFHPEKSQDAGLRIVKNFVELK